MTRTTILILLAAAAAACKSTPKDETLEEGEEVNISADELEPVAMFLLENRRLIAAEFVRIEATPQFFEQKMGFTRDLQFVDRKTWVENGARIIELKNRNPLETNMDPDLLPRVYFGQGLEVRAYKVIRIYFRTPKTKERPLRMSVIAKNVNGDAKMWINGRLDKEQPRIVVRTELIWHEEKERYVHKGAIE